MAAMPDPDEILARMMDDGEHDWDLHMAARVNVAPVVDESRLYGTKLSRRGGLTATRDLSGRERDVLTAFSQGLRVREAAEVLGIAPGTVRTHLLSARRKLAAKNTPHAVARALRSGQII